MTTRTRTLLALLTLLAIAAPGTGASAAHRLPMPPAAAVPAVHWTSGGPYADDATAVVASPTFERDHTVFLGVVYNTNRGGPAGNTTVAILRSQDGGSTWQRVWSRATPPDSSNMQGSLVQLAISPAFAADGTVFALWSADGSGVLRSTDGGRSFQPAGGGLPALDYRAPTLSLSPDFGADRTVAVSPSRGTSSSSYLSTDGGSTWRAVSVAAGSGLCAVSGGGFLLALGRGTLGSYLPAGNAVCSNNLATLFATSTDGGHTWTAMGNVTAGLGARSFDPQHSRLIATANGHTIIVSSETEYNAIAASFDGGRHWQDRHGPVLGAYVPPQGGEAPFSFTLAPDGRRIYALQPSAWRFAPRLYVSDDEGRTWRLLWAGHGMTASHAVAEAGPHTLFFAAGNEGLLRSSDGGHAWQSVGTFRPDEQAVATSPAFARDHTVFGADIGNGLSPQLPLDRAGYGITRSPSSGAVWSEPEAPDPFPGTLYTTALGGTLSLAVSPAYARDHTVFSGDRAGTVRISHDGGATWTTSLIAGQEAWRVYAIAVSPAYARDRRVYLGLVGIDVMGFGLVRSTDGGRTWRQEVDPGEFHAISQSVTHDVAVTRDRRAGVLDVVIATGDLYLWQDDGRDAHPPRWLSLNRPGVFSVAFSPDYTRDCTIYAAQGAGGQVLGNTIEDGLYVSTHACPADARRHAVTWTWLRGLALDGEVVRDVSSIAISPDFSRDHTLFVGSRTRGVFGSADAGKTWVPLDAGLGNLAVNHLALALTGRTTATLVAATESGVWQSAVPLGRALWAARSAPAHATATPRPTEPALPTATPEPASATVTTTPQPTSTATPLPTGCTSRDLSGTWSYTASSTANGPQNGIATLQQAGATVSGTLAQSTGGTYTLEGTLQGALLTLTFRQAGQVDQTYTFTVSADGTTLRADQGTFTGHAACR